MKNRHLYPPNWSLLSQLCREQAHWTCEGCGVKQGTERLSRRGNLYKVRLAACHIDHEERYQADAELICLCERCHWWHDFTQWQLDQWRSLETLKHALLRTNERIAKAQARAKDRIYSIVMEEHGHPAST